MGACSHALVHSGGINVINKRFGDDNTSAFRHRRVVGARPRLSGFVLTCR